FPTRRSSDLSNAESNPALYEASFSPISKDLLYKSNVANTSAGSATALSKNNLKLYVDFVLKSTATVFDENTVGKMVELAKAPADSAPKIVAKDFTKASDSAPIEDSLIAPFTNPSSTGLPCPFTPGVIFLRTSTCKPTVSCSKTDFATYTCDESV